MTKFNNHFIGTCIKNYRKSIGLTQTEFVKDICCLYTLSRLERGKTDKSLSLHKLLIAYNLHLNDSFSFSLLEMEYTNLLAYITYGDKEKIEQSIYIILDISYNNRTHLIMNQYYKYAIHLKTHFIDEKPIIFDKYTFNTMTYLTENMYSIHLHITMENAFTHATIINLKPLYNMMACTDISNIITDMYHCIYIQTQDAFSLSHDISSKYRLEIRDNSYHLHHIRYRILDACSLIYYEPNKSIHILEDVIHEIHELNVSEHYTYVCRMAQMVTYIKEKEYTLAHHTIVQHLLDDNELKSFVIPYGILLTLILNIEADERLLTANKHLLIVRMQELYSKHSDQLSVHKAFSFLNTKVLYLCKHYNEKNAFIILFKEYAKQLNRKTKLKKQYIRFEITLKEVIRRSHDV